jgi:hypothetical protein
VNPTRVNQMPKREARSYVDINQGSDEMLDREKCLAVVSYSKFERRGSQEFSPKDHILFLQVGA